MSGSERFPEDGCGVVALAAIERFERAGTYVVAVVGEIDLSNVGAVEGAARGASNQALGVVLDLSATAYIDSATVGMLFRLRGSLRRRGQALRVVCARGSSAGRVLELTGFSRRLAPEESRDAAIAAIHAEVEGSALDSH